LNIVFVKISKKTQLCEWKERDPHRHGDSITLVIKRLTNAETPRSRLI